MGLNTVLMGDRSKTRDEDIKQERIEREVKKEQEEEEEEAIDDAEVDE